jgi:hypothetical protein
VVGYRCGFAYLWKNITDYRQDKAQGINKANRYKGKGFAPQEIKTERNGRSRCKNKKQYAYFFRHYLTSPSIVYSPCFIFAVVCLKAFVTNLTKRYRRIAATAELRTFNRKPYHWNTFPGLFFIVIEFINPISWYA